MARHIILTVLALALAFPVSAQAQDKWPTRPVTLLVPFPPGGMADQTARPLAQALEKQLKQPVVVLNRPGASGAVGIYLASTQSGTASALIDSFSVVKLTPSMTE